jgi:hypothetical protein
MKPSLAVKTPASSRRSFPLFQFLTVSLVLALLIVGTESIAQSKLLNKVISKVSKKVGGAGTATASSLDDIMPSVAIGSNLHPAELGTLSQSFFEDWKAGGDQVAIMFTKKNSPGYFKLDGSVTVNGEPLNYTTLGVYDIITAPNSAPRKVEIKTTSGQSSSFTIEPVKNKITLVAINGQKENISLDLSKDVVLEVEGISPSENPLMKVSIAINQVGIKSIYDVCYIRSGSKLTIPAAAFRNINIVPGGDAVYSYKKSFLSVGFESVETAKDISGSIASVQYTRSINDGKFVNVTTEPELNKGLTVKGSEVNMNYDIFKPNAFMSRPFSQAKKFGVISFSIRGTTYREVTTESNQNYTKSAALVFPQQPDAVWDALMEKLYPELIAVVKSELHTEEIPVDKITGSDAYRNTEAFAKDDANTTVAFARSYHNTKVVSAFMPVTEGFGSNGVNQRIMNETGADALLKMTLDLQISYDEKDSKSVYVVMIPRFAFELSGKSNGILTNTKFVTGTINSASGVKIKETMTPEDIEAIVRKSDLLTVFRKALHDIVEKEKANSDYETVWNLQK